MTDNSDVVLWVGTQVKEESATLDIDDIVYQGTIACLRIDNHVRGIEDDACHFGAITACYIVWRISICVCAEPDVRDGLIDQVLSTRFDVQSDHERRR